MNLTNEQTLVYSSMKRENKGLDASLSSILKSEGNVILSVNARRMGKFNPSLVVKDPTKDLPHKPP